MLSSLETGRLVPEEEFEIKGDDTVGLHCGPKLSRTSASYLLQGYTVAFIGRSSKITQGNNNSDIVCDFFLTSNLYTEEKSAYDEGTLAVYECCCHLHSLK